MDRTLRLLLSTPVWIRTPAAQVYVRCSLSTRDNEGLHQIARVGVGAFQVVAGRPGIGIIFTSRQGNAEEILVLGDRELDRLCGSGFLEVERHRRVELAGVAQAPGDGSVSFIRYGLDLNIEGFIRFAARAEQRARGITQHPVADVLTGGGGRCQRNRHIHGLAGGHVSGQANGRGGTHLVAAGVYQHIVRRPGAGAAVL